MLMVGPITIPLRKHVSGSHSCLPNLANVDVSVSMADGGVIKIKALIGVSPQ